MAPLFAFVQCEFPWLLGPADGRYLVRVEPQAAPEHVVVLATLGAPRRHRLRGRRTRAAAPSPEPTPVTVTRATVINPRALEDESAARAWMARADVEAETQAAIGVLDRLLFAQRIATADPYVHEVSAHQALALRVGWGEGEQVADGRWREARELTPGPGRRGRRAAVLRPQERLSLLLGARDEPLVGEELALRAREDLDHGRPHLAALELRGAYATLLPALGAERRPDLAARLHELSELQTGVQAAAQAVLEGRAEDVEQTATAHALGRLEAALRARAAAGFHRSGTQA